MPKIPYTTPFRICTVLSVYLHAVKNDIHIISIFFYSFLLSNKHGYKQYTEQLCCIKQYLIVVYDISTAPTITVKSLI